MASAGPPSNGTGCCSGIGTRGKGGIGDEGGPGYGGVRPGVYRVGGEVSAPKLVFHPEPDYSEDARKAKLQGMVLVDLVVGADGVPRDIRVISGPGLGLEEKAVEAVTRWRFRPGMRKGKPVPVIARIEVNFRVL